MKMSIIAIWEGLLKGNKYTKSNRRVKMAETVNKSSNNTLFMIDRLISYSGSSSTCSYGWRITWTQHMIGLKNQ